ncbi:MAG TPA: cation-translocating P-type ATPase, partial [Propionibacteriaceae bacterium]|nr:cation-translocating P-type ATPase [Propionibacteriaceae bacterium]
TAMAALAALSAARATVLREGALVTVASAEIVRGDILVLAAGDAVGADARLFQCATLRVQESSLTGESVATEKDAATLPARGALGDRLNMVFTGTDVVQGVGRAVVTATGMSTEVGAIADLMEHADRAPTPLQREIASISRTLGLVILGIAVVVMAILALMQGVHSLSDAVDIALMGLSLAVAAVPEGLPAVLSLVLAIGVRALAQQRAIMKDLHAVEALGSTSVICSDKTGTLTRNQMTLRVVATASGQIELTGTGYQPVGEVVAPGGSPEGLWHEVRHLLIGGALANNAQLSEVDGEWQIEGDPTEAAFLVAHHKLDGAASQASLYRRTGEVPFTSERRLMSVIVEHPHLSTHHLFTKGAPDTLVTRCEAVQLGNGVVTMDAGRRARAHADIARLSEAGYRTLGVAYRVLDEASTSPGDIDESSEHGLILLGVVGILDPPREGVIEAVRSAHRAGIRTIMITGDHPVTARRIAADLGIVAENAPVASGNELDAMDAEHFRDEIRSTSVFARVAPSHKLRIVETLQSDDLLVAMTGDGVNDAPALKAANVGVAMGRAGTEVAKRAAVMVLADDNYATLVAAVRQGRLIFDNIRKFLRYLLSSNLGEVVTLLFGVVLAGPLGLHRAAVGSGLVVPLLATQILWINLVTDSAPALALGMDPEIDDVMARPPRRPDQRILGRSAWFRIGLSGLAMGASALLAIDVFLPGGMVEGTASGELARTAAFTTLVLAQLFNALSVR